MTDEVQYPPLPTDRAQLDELREWNAEMLQVWRSRKDAYIRNYVMLGRWGQNPNNPALCEWMQRLTNAFPKFVWINPEPQGVWQYRQSISVIQQLVNQRMYPLTIKGLEEAMRLLSK